MAQLDRDDARAEDQHTAPSGPEGAGTPHWTDLVRTDAAQLQPARLARMQRAAGNAEVARLLGELAPPRLGVSRAPEPAAAVAAPGGTLLVSADVEDPGPNRMAVDAFLDAVERAVSDVAAKELGAMFEIAGCPWLEHWIGYYRSKPAHEVEEALKRYAPDAARAASAQDYVALVVSRVREGIATWRTTGQTPEPPAGSPGAPPGQAPARQDGDGPAPAFQMQPGAATPDPGRSRIGGGLGAGERLDGPIGSTVGAAYGADFSGVRVHRDGAAAALVSGMNARAVTVGKDIAFASGEYEPGTLMGDALIAHELAHVMQQTGNGPATADVAALEADANVSALAALAGKAVRPPSRSANPLRAQSCGVGDKEKTDVFDEEAEAIAKKSGVELHSEPAAGDKDVPTGFSPRFWLTAPETAGQGGRGQTHGVANWFVKKPGADFRRRNHPEPGRRFTVEMDEPGLWLVAAQIHFGDVDAYLIRRYQVVEENAIADEGFKTTNTSDYVGYRTLMNQERLKRTGGADLDQSKATGPWITNETAGARNPSPPSMDPSTYKVHADPKAPPEKRAVKFRWWAIPRDHDEHNYTGRVDLGTRTSYKGDFAFYRGEQEVATFRADSAARIEMVCELIGEGDKLVGTATYTQMVMNSHDLDRVAQIDKMIKEGAAGFAKIEQGKARGMKAMHLDARRNSTSALNLFVGPKAGDPGQVMLVDLTPGAEYVEHEAKTVEAAIKHLEDNNSYGKGQVLVHYDGPPAVDRRFKTDGDTDLEEAASKTGIGSAVLVGLGVIASFTPAAVAAPYLIAGGLGLGVASGGMSIANELRKAHPSPLKISIDVAGIVGALVGAGGMAQAARMGSVELAMTTVAGRFFIYTGFAFDATGGLLLAVDTAEKIEQIRKSSSMSEDEKIDAIQKLILQAVVVGGLIAYGARDIGTARQRVVDFVGEERVAKVRPESLYTLQSLDDAALQSLRKVPVENFTEVAAAMAKDPRKATALSKAYGDRFIEELRANPARSLDEVADVLGAKAAGAAPGPVGGVRGADVYELKGGKNAIKSPSRFLEGLEAKNLKSSRLHQASVDSVSVAPGTADKKTVGTVEMTVKGEKVMITVEPRASADLAKGAHGGDAGSARIAQLTPPAKAGDPWKATVHLDEQTTRDLVPITLGHELDEMADFIATKGAKNIGTLGNEMEAGIFVTWADRRRTTPPPVTSHDRANAREFLNVMAEHQEALKQAKKDANMAARAAERQESLKKLVNNMGLRDPQFIETKLATLRESMSTLDTERTNLLTTKPKDGLSPFDQMIEDLQRGVTRTEAASATATGYGGTRTTFDDGLVAHAMKAKPRTHDGFMEGGISGGHHDESLKEFVKANPNYAIVQKHEANSGFTTYRSYEQYRWNEAHPAAAGKSPTPAGQPGHPATTGHPIDAPWTKAPAEFPKTTFDDPITFFADADRIIKQWQGNLSAADLAKPMKGPRVIGGDPGVMMHFTYTPGDAAKGTSAVWDIRSVFIDEKWIETTAKAAATPTPPPAGVTK